MLVLVRDKKSDLGISGRLYLNGCAVCFTLENRSKAIPAGVYNVQNSRSPKFRRELPLIYNSTDVKSSRGIRIHSGNVAERDSQGCVLVGMKRRGSEAVGFQMLESTLAETMVTMLCRNCDQLLIVENFSTN